MNETTDPSMELLDRRAADAVARLDETVDAAPIPDFGTVADQRPSRHRIPPAAIAAGLLVLALVAAGFLLTGGSDEQGTVAGEPEPTDRVHLVLADPEADGYEIAAVFDSEHLSTTPTGVSIPATAQALPADDPWTHALVEYALPSESTTLDGETVDLAGTPGAFRERDGLLSVGWEAGDQTRYLVSTDLNRIELVKAATRAIVVDAGPGEPIAEYEILFRGTVADVFQSQTTLPPPGTSGVAYVGATEQNRDLIIRTSAGSDDALRAARVLAVERTPATVRGHDAVVTVGPEGLTEVTWMEDQQTVARVGTSAPTLDLDLLDRLRVIDQEGFVALLEDHAGEAPEPPIGDSRTEPFEDVGAPVLAEVSMTEGSTTYRAALTRSEAGELTVEASHDGPNGSASTGSSLPALDQTTAVRHDAGTATVIAGVVGPDVTDLAVDCGETVGCDVDISGPSTAGIEGSSSVLFFAVIPGGGGPFFVTGVDSDGTEFRVGV